MGNGGSPDSALGFRGCHSNRKGLRHLVSAGQVLEARLPMWSLILLHRWGLATGYEDQQARL